MKRQEDSLKPFRLTEATFFFDFVLGGLWLKWLPKIPVTVNKPVFPFMFFPYHPKTFKKHPGK